MLILSHSQFRLTRAGISAKFDIIERAAMKRRRLRP
jgi:hypothetical protein